MIILNKKDLKVRGSSESLSTIIDKAIFEDDNEPLEIILDVSLRGEELLICPCCKQPLFKRCHHPRKIRGFYDKQIIIHIPRYECRNKQCSSINKNIPKSHIVVPDLIIPLKRYAKQVINLCINNGKLPKTAFKDAKEILKDFIKCNLYLIKLWKKCKTVEKIMKHLLKIRINFYKCKVFSFFLRKAHQNEVYVKGGPLIFVRLIM